MKNAILSKGWIWILIWTFVGIGCKATPPPQEGPVSSYKAPDFPVINSRVRSPIEFKRVGPLPEFVAGDIEVPVKDSKHKMSAQDKLATVHEGEKLKKPSYLSDDEYIALNRHERLFLQTPGEKRSGLSVHLVPEPRDTVNVRDKPLIFAGKGFEIDDFRGLSEERLYFRFTRHLERDLPLVPPAKPREKLELDVEHTASTRDVVFHSPRAAFNKPLASDVEVVEEHVVEKKQPYVRRTPETKVLLEKGYDTNIVLEPSDKTMDLLIGNETLNREIFKKGGR